MGNVIDKALGEGEVLGLEKDRKEERAAMIKKLKKNGFSDSKIQRFL